MANLKKRTRAQRFRQRRNSLFEHLEHRRMLASDLPAVALDAGDSLVDLGAVAAFHLADEAARSSITEMAEGEAAPAVLGFGQSLRAALIEISRVVDAIGQMPTFDQVIPFLGEALPVDAGGTSVIDTDTVGSLFGLSSRFEQEIATPLRSYLDSHPAATPEQLISQFGFLAAIDDALGAVSGVKLNLDFQDQLQRPIESLLRPLTQLGGIFQVSTGDALADSLQFEISTEGFDFEITVNEDEEIKVGVPNFSLKVGNADLSVANLVGQVGMLAGTLFNPQIDLDLEWSLDAGSLFGGGLGSPRAPTLEALQSISAQSIISDFVVEQIGDGLLLDFPFDFNLPGFLTAGFKPQLILADENPLDRVFPQFELVIPRGAPYDLDAILALTNITPSEMLGHLNELGSMLGQIQEGSLLNVPIPFSNDVTIGEALGLAESYASGVLQFLKTGEGLPKFSSIQELIQLMPGIDGSVFGPLPESPVRYDPNTQTLDITLDFFRSPDPILLQGDLSLLAGDPDAPFFSVQMNDTDPETGAPRADFNRLTVTRNASLGLDLQIDLSLNKDESIRRDLKPFDDSTKYRVAPWTRMDEFARRLGFADELGLHAIADVTLADGTVGVLDFGVLDPSRTVGDLMDQAVVAGDQIFGELVFDQSRAVMFVELEVDSFLTIRDRSTDSGSFVVIPRRGPENAGLFWDNLFGASKTDFNEFTGSSLFMRSAPLFASFLDGRFTQLPGGGSETPLPWLFPDMSRSLADLSQPLKPLVAHLRDGRTVNLEFSDFAFETIESVLTRLSAEIASQPVLEAKIENERIVIRDLTNPTGSDRLRIEWADEPGLPLLSQIVALGEDGDLDGQLVGPRLIPALTNDLRTSIDFETRLVDLAAQYGVDPSADDSITFFLKDGTTQNLTKAGYNSTETLGDLHDSMQSLSNVSMGLVNGEVRFSDDTFVESDRLFRVETTSGGLFEAMFPLETRIDLDDDYSLSSRTVTTSGVNTNTLLSDLLPVGLDDGVSGSAQVKLADGTTEHLDLRNISDSTTLNDVLNQWTVLRTGSPVIVPYLAGGRIVLQDLSDPQPGHTLKVRVSGAASLVGVLLKNAEDKNGTGIVTGRELRSAIPAPLDALFFINNDPPVAEWTPLKTIADRMFAGNSGISAELQVMLRDGTNVTFNAILDDTQTVAGLVRAGQHWRGDELIAELTFEQNRLVLVDYTQGAGDINLVGEEDRFDFLQVLFRTGKRDSSGDRWTSGPLSRNFLDQAGPFGVLPLREIDPAEQDLAIDPIADQLTRNLNVHLRDGSDYFISSMRIDGITVRHYLNRLTIRDGQTVLMQPMVVDGRIVLADQTQGAGVFSVTEESTIHEDDRGSPLHARVLGLGRDIVGLGQLVGPSLVKTLPSLADPIREQLKVVDLVESIAAGRSANQVVGNATTAEIQLSDGTTETLSIEPLDRNRTLGDLLPLMVIERDGAVIFDVALDSGRLIAADKTVATGSDPFRILDPDFGGTRLFSILGLVGTDDDTDGLIEGRYLFESDPADIRTVDELGLGPLSSNSSVTLSLRDGSTEVVSVGELTGDDFVFEVVERLNVEREGVTIVKAQYVGNSVVLEDRTQPDGQSIFSISVGGSVETFPTSLFAPLTNDLDDDGRIISRPLVRALPITVTGPEIQVAELNARFGLPRLTGSDEITVEITLRNGSVHQRVLQLHPGMTIAEFLAQMTVTQEGAAEPSVVFEAGLANVVGDATSPSSPRWRVVLRDRTEAIDGGGETQVRAIGAGNTNPATLLPTFLGIFGRDTNNTGVIVGNSLELIDDSERVRIKLTEPPTLAASISAHVSNVNASVRVGELASASLRDGNGLASVTVQLQIVPPIGRDYVTVNDLIAAISNPRDRLAVEISTDFQFGAELVLDLGGLNEQFAHPADTPRVDIAWPGFLTQDPNLHVQFDTLDVNFTNAENLFQLKQLTLQDITNLIRKVVDLVGRISDDDLLNKQLPLVNTSIGEVLDTVDYVDDLVQQTLDDPNATLKTLESQLESALGLSDDQLTLSYDEPNNAIKIELDLAVSSGPVTSALDLDLADVGLPGLEELVDFQATGVVNVDADAHLALHVGIGLDALGLLRQQEEQDAQNPDQPAQANFDSVVIVYDTTSVNATARVAATDLQFTTAIGPLGVDVGPGAVVLDADGLAFGGSGTDDRANLSITLPAATGGIYPLTSLSPDDFEFTFEASAGLDLPLTFNLGSTTTQPLQIHWPDLNSLQFDQVETINTAGSNQIVLPDLGQAIDGFDASDGVYALVAGLEGLFNFIEGYLGDEVLGIPVPIIGNGLTAVTGFLADLRDDLSSAIDLPGLGAEAARQLIFDALGPAGLNVLDDLNQDGAITREDVGLNGAGSGQGEADGEAGDEIAYRLKLAGRLDIIDAGIDLDVGVPALNLNIGGDIATTVAWQMDIGFGLNQTQGVFIEFFDNDELTFSFTASIDDLAAQGRLGPVALSASTIDASDLTAAQRAASLLYPDIEGTEVINGLAGVYEIDLGQGRFGLASLGDLGALGIETNARLAGSLHLDILTGLETEAKLPSIAAGVHVTWPSVEGSLGDLLDGLTRPGIEFTDVALDLGSFISDIIGPTLAPINEMIDPIRPILDALTTPIPVISDLAGEVTFVDLMALFGSGGETVARFVESAASLADLINIPIVNGNVRLPLGDFLTEFSAGQGDNTGGLNVTAQGGGQDLDSFLAGLSPDDEVRQYLENMPRTNADGELEPGKFSFPFLQNPTQVIGILLGQDVTLIEYDVPRLEASFGYQQYFPIWPIFGITVSGELSIAADFKFGYDTFGIRQFAETNRVQDLFNGFFLDDRIVMIDGESVDLPEVEFEAALLAGGQLNLLVASAGVEGGLFASVDLNLNDPNGDGKIRAQELLDNLSLGRHPLLGPLWIFDASGKLEVGLRAYVEAPVLGEKELDLGRFTILDFDIPRPQPGANDLQLASLLGDGTLLLHAGPNAQLRENGNTSDGDEEFFVDRDPSGSQVVVSAFGIEARYDDVERIVVDLGQGNDSLVIGESLNLPVEVSGGPGHDEITGGAGPLTVIGGTGNDVIIGSIVGDHIDGGEGNDEIRGRAGNDVLIGGAGDDVIRGGAGIDRIDGGANSDRIHGGFGADFLTGGSGADYIDGEDGDDVIFGDLEGSVDSPESASESQDDGDDILYGGLGSDLIVGDGGNDQLIGGAGGDQLFAGSGNDLLIAGTQPPTDNVRAQQSLFVGGEDDRDPNTLDAGDGDDIVLGSLGNDIVFAASGLNIIRTYGGNDVITTGDGDDVIESGAGDDIINAGAGANEIHAGAGFDDVTTGIGDDLIDMRGSAPDARIGGIVNDAGGNNRVFGDHGDDVIVLLGGDNWVNAGDGNNTITAGPGNDVIMTASGADIVNAGDGENDVATGAGDDVITTGSGRDHVNSGGGNDTVQTGSGDDVIDTGAGNDIINTGGGDDVVNAGQGDDYVVAGRGSDTILGGDGSDIVWAGLEFYTSAELLSSLTTPGEFDLFGTYNGFVAPFIFPGVIGEQSISGTIDDGNDVVDAGDGNDFVFGGGGNDNIDGGDGDNYLDGGAGADIVVGGSGVDLIRGGSGDDDLRGGLGIDLIFGDEGDDLLRGDGGVDTGQGHEIFGQILFGGPGRDTLLAYAHSTDVTVESLSLGDRLDGGSGIDLLLGNLRQETMLGGPGDDTLEGDRLGGPNYAPRQGDEPLLSGAADTMFGGSGDDQLFGHGGDDEMWGGGDTDILRGHAGVDVVRGGTGIDFIYLDVDARHAASGGQLDGFFGNRNAGDVPDDNATDILVIEGTPGNDTIRLGSNAAGQLSVEYNGFLLEQDFRDANGNATIEQFQIDGFAGNDTIEFASTLDLGQLAARSRDWVGVINGGSGNDILRGSAGRDRISGGPGSDVVVGLAGDDRLWGDDLDGQSGDLDILYAGTGNDDLIGGIGDNQLYAWSDDPSAGTAFGRYVDPGTGEIFDSPAAGRVLEDTGLNRMLGRDGDDELYAGTGLDFMYGSGGDNTLYGPDGVALQFGIGVPESEQWLEYAKSTDKVWFYGGSGSDDVISVDFVTEPGVLGDHHLITRLTENNGLFTFDAQVQLDFDAVDQDGQLIWDPNDVVYKVQELLSAEDGDARQLVQRDIELTGGLLPPEGDYLAIVIDAKAGDDEIYVGPTVQRSVWIAAGDGADVVRIAGGTPLLVDLADADNRNEMPGAPNDPSRAYQLGTIEDTTLLANLTLDSPNDVDWFEIEFDDTPALAAAITVDSIAATDFIELELWEKDADGNTVRIASGAVIQQEPPANPDKPARFTLSVGNLGLSAELTYFIRVRSAAAIPTLYDLGIDIGEGRPLGDITVDFGVASQDVLRRDVIVGGAGDDILMGGPGEDWVIGGPGNDVLAGGYDQGASDIIIGEAGDDLLQVMIDALPSDLAGNSLQLTLADQLEGGDGFDRVLILGGDVDRFGIPIPDHLTLSYNIPLGTTTVAGQNWDTANQRWLKVGGDFVIHQAQFQARQVEGTLIDLRGGDDELHLEDGYQFPGANGGDDPTYGIAPGHRQAGGSHLAFEIRGGVGNDRIFGSPAADFIDAGAGIDFVAGLGGDDNIIGGADDDLLVGAGSDVTPIDLLEASTRDGLAVRNDAALFATPIDLTGGPVSGLTFQQGDAADWYVVPLPSDGAALSASDVTVTFDDVTSMDAFTQDWSEPLVSLTPAVFDQASGGYLPAFSTSSADAYLLGIGNPRSRAIIADNPNRFGSLSGTTSLSLGLKLDNRSARDFGIRVDASTSGQQAAEMLNEALADGNLDDEVFAEYDARENRVMLVMRRTGTMRTIGNASSWDVLGFKLGQTITSSPTSLGGYTLDVAGTFDPPAGPALEVAPYRMEIGTVGAFFDPPIQPLMLAESDPRTLTAAMRLEGPSAHEAIGFSSVVGDINADGFDDLLIAGIQTAYVLLGPVDPQADVVAMADAADLTIDLSADGDLASWTPIEGGQDLDGDGSVDLAFYRFTQSLGTVRLDVAVLSAGEVASGNAQVELDGVLAISLPATVVQSPDTVDIGWLEYDGTVGGDLMVIAGQPVLERGTAVGHGGVFAGEILGNVLQFGLSPASPELAIAWIKDGTETQADVLTTLPSNYQLPGSTIPSEFRQQLQAVPIDADGDGQDEIALIRPHGWVFQDRIHPADLLVVGRVYLLDSGGFSTIVDTGDFDAPAVIQLTAVNRVSDPFDIKELRTAALNRTQAAIAADFDFDGIDELVLASDGPGATGRKDLLVFAEVTVANGLLDGRDAVLAIQNVTPDMARLRSMGVGDFDHDFSIDLVVAADSGSAGGVRVIYDPLTSAAAEFDVLDAKSGIDTELFVSIAPGDGLGIVASRSGDFTGDGIDDLAVGAERFDAVGRNIETNAGAVFLMSGQRRPGEIANADGAVVLENFTVRGLGGAVVDAGSMVTFSRTNASDPDDFTLLSGSDFKLFQFRTLGDGRPGDLLRLGPGVGVDPIVPVAGLAVSIEPGGSGQYPFGTIEVGGAGKRIGLIEFDLGKLMPALTEPQRLLGAELSLFGSASAETEVAIDFFASDGDGTFRDKDGEVSSAKVLFSVDPFVVGKDAQRFTFDLAAASDLEELRSLLAAGTRYLTARITANTTDTVVSFEAPNIRQKEPTGLLLRQQPGAIGTLMDQEGRVLQAESPGFDLRNLEAGTYYLRVASADPAGQVGTVSFDVTFDAPGLGAFDPSLDNDRVRGGDGDDILVGGPGRDALWGDGGADVFTAESFELRDRQENERLREPLADDELGFDHSPLVDDPLVVVDPNPIEDPPRGVVEIADALVAEAIGRAIGVDLVLRADGEYQFARTVHASDLGGVVYLDLSDQAVFELAGIEVLSGLVSLDLSGNALFPEDLDPLLPGQGGITGASGLAYLNLDRNLLDSVDSLAMLTQLQVLSAANNTGEEGSLYEISEIGALDNLVYASFSGNEIEDINRLFGTYLLDDNPRITSGSFSRSGDWHAATSSIPVVGDTYHYYDATIGAGDGTAKFTSAMLLPGSYDVFASWRGDETNASEVFYDVDGADRFTAAINQRLDPFGPVFGGFPFERLGTVNIVSPGALTVAISAGSADGLVIADALLIRPVNPTIPNFETLDLTRNPLEEAFHQVLADSVTSQTGIDLIYTDVARPQWNGQPTAVAEKLGQNNVIPDVRDYVSTGDDQFVSIRLDTYDENLIAFAGGSVLNIRQRTPQAEMTQVLVTGRGELGRLSTIVLNVGFGGSVVEGSVSDRTATEGLAASRAFLDKDGDTQWDPASEPHAVADLDGQFWLYTTITQPVNALADPQSDWLAIQPDGGIEIGLGANPAVYPDVEFKVARAISFEIPTIADEGDRIAAKLLSSASITDVQWTIAGVVDDVTGNDTSLLEFLVVESGIYQVSVAAEASDGNVYRAYRTMRVRDIAPRADAGGDRTIGEGLFQERRTVIVDPGNEIFTVAIDYGDGSQAVVLEPSSLRHVDLNHLYGTPGTYTVTVTVSNDEGESTDSFALEVLSVDPTLSIIVAGIDTIVKGQPVTASITIKDPTLQADPYGWEYVLDWGDGTSQPIGELLSFDSSDVIVATVELEHLYDTEGETWISLIVVDDDGVATRLSQALRVGNDLPLVVADVPDRVDEDTPFVLTVDATDLDGIGSIKWAFSDGSPTQFGREVVHLFADPGTHSVAVTVIDMRGAETSVQYEVIVTNVLEAPVVESIARQTIAEQTGWSYQVRATDLDAGTVPDSLEYRLGGNAESLGISIDSTSGMINWTPSVEDGPNQYQFDVVVSKSGLSSAVPIVIDVLDSGSIEGMLFADASGNGNRDEGELPLEGVVVGLDVGDDGTIDRTATTDALGRYHFDALARGLYRIRVEFDPAWELTTPRELVFDLSTAIAHVAPDLGGLADSDGDGISNADELASSAGVDGNGDGQPDWQQGSVASVETEGGVVTIVSSLGTVLANISSATAVRDASDNTAYPFGRISFDVTGLPVGNRAEVELILGANSGISAVFQVDESKPADEVFRLLGQADDESVEVEDDRLVIELFDGSDADLDAIANGRASYSLQPLAIDSIWTNPDEATDVDGDGITSPLDALRIINRLNQGQGTQQLPGSRPPGEYYWDVSGDGFLSPLDALLIINYLNRE